MVDIIIDIETLGTKPGCVILEIGACAVDHGTGELFTNFSRRLDEVFTRFDAWVKDSDAQETLVWWMREHPDTYTAIVRRGDGLYENRSAALDLKAFCDWFEDVTRDATAVRVWGNGPSFDLSILRAGIELYGFKQPWHHTWERDVRTALEQAGYERGSTSWIERGPRHRALNDARHEARKLYYSGALGEVSAIIKRLRQRGVVKWGLA